MEPVSLLGLGVYSSEWIKDFHTQAGFWQDTDPQASGVHQTQVKTVECLCGAEPKAILDLGMGPGATADALADTGHHVVAMELSPTRAKFARELAKIPRKGSLTILEDDFYIMELRQSFDLVCSWETFVLGTDADQRRLLKRIADEQLGPKGCVLDGSIQSCPPRAGGRYGEAVISPLNGVPYSVEMINRCHLDPLRGRWIDEWIPVAEPGKALAQTIRCYKLPDLLLLLVGTRLEINRIEVDGHELDVESIMIATSSPLMNAWCYLVQLACDDQQAFTTFPADPCSESG